MKHFARRILVACLPSAVLLLPVSFSVQNLSLTTDVASAGSYASCVDGTSVDTAQFGGSDYAACAKHGGSAVNQVIDPTKAVTNKYALSPDGIVPKTNATIGDGLSRVVTLLLQIIGSLSVIMIIVGGLLMVLSAGNPARFKQGREAILYAVVGLTISLTAYAIIGFVTGSL
jgi:hypothetical protein